MVIPAHTQVIISVAAANRDQGAFDITLDYVKGGWRKSEIALPRNATVLADTDMELLVLGQREFAGLLAALGAAVAGAIVVMKVVPAVPGSFTRAEWIAFGGWSALGLAFWWLRGGPDPLTRGGSAPPRESDPQS